MTHDNDQLNSLCPTGAYGRPAPVKSFTPASSDCYKGADGKVFVPNTLPLPGGTHVKAGCQIGFSGDAGVPGQAHLHFEVQKIVERSDVKVGAKVDALSCFKDGKPPYTEATFDRDHTRICLPQDPYGWTCPQQKCPNGDPYQSLTGVANQKYWAQ